MFGTNWKTTAGGIASIFGGLGVVLHMYSTGNWDIGLLGTTLTAIGAGAVGLLAKDHNVSNSPTPVAAKTVP